MHGQHGRERRKPCCFGAPGALSHAHGKEPPLHEQIALCIAPAALGTDGQRNRVRFANPVCDIPPSLRSRWVQEQPHAARNERTGVHKRQAWDARASALLGSLDGDRAQPRQPPHAPPGIHAHDAALGGHEHDVADTELGRLLHDNLQFLARYQRLHEHEPQLCFACLGAKDQGFSPVASVPARFPFAARAVKEDNRGARRQAQYARKIAPLCIGKRHGAPLEDPHWDKQSRAHAAISPRHRMPCKGLVSRGTRTHAWAMRIERWLAMPWMARPEGAREPLASALTFRGSFVRWCAARGLRLALRVRAQEMRPCSPACAEALKVHAGTKVLMRHAVLLWGGQVAVEAWSAVPSDALPLALAEDLARGEAPLGELWQRHGFAFVRTTPGYARVDLAPWGACWARRSLLVADEAGVRALLIEVFTPVLVRALRMVQARRAI